MNEEMHTQLTQIHNILYSMSVSGENTLKLAACLAALRSLLEPAASTEAKTEVTDHAL